MTPLRDPSADAGAESTIDVSVVVSTRDRAGQLPELFGALGAQATDLNFELVIIDNGSVDDTAAVIAKLAALAPFAVVTDTLPRGSGPARGRNHGVQLAHGEIIAFTDDDCHPDPRWIEAGARALGSSAAVVVGRTRGPSGQPTLSQHPMTSKVITNDCRYFATCNVFYRRQDVLDVGGFDTEFRGVGGEDTDLGLRVCKAGAEALFVPEALVVHPYRRHGPRSAIVESTRWYDLPRLIAKHPEQRVVLLHWRWFWKRTHPGALIAALALIAAPLAPVALVGVLPWLRERVLLTNRSRKLSLLWAPVLFSIDLVEIMTMTVGSVRHRTLVL